MYAVEQSKKHKIITIIMINIANNTKRVTLKNHKLKCAYFEKYDLQHSKKKKIR